MATASSIPKPCVRRWGPPCRSETPASGYARALSVGIDDRDHEAADRFVRAMSPVDTYRITTGKTDDEGDDDDGTDPVTPVDAGPGGPTPPPFG